MGARRHGRDRVRSSTAGNRSSSKHRSPSAGRSSSPVSGSRSPPPATKSEGRKKKDTSGSKASNASSRAGTSATQTPRSSSPPRARSSSPASPSDKEPEKTSPPKALPVQRPAPVKFWHRRTGAEVWRCKKAKRTDIKPSEWDKFGYANNDEPLTRPIVYDEQTVPIPRVKRKDITPEWFYENAAKPHRPIIVEGVTDDWPAMHRWSLEAMEERFRNVAFKVAKDDKGKKLRMKFKYYADYLRRQQDDSPLYLFETNVDDNGYIRPLVEDFEKPDLFPHDYFALVNDDARPPHRWFCIGPKRSGTTVHTDPLGTAAWNVVTHGCKHWVLMEPKETKRVVKGKDLLKDGEDDEAIMYFDFLLPRIKRAHPELKIYEGLQHPGEVIFVPGDWWHGVVNTEDCVAITQNYCGPDNFDVVWTKTRKEREKIAHLWLRNMRKFAPPLADKALEMNRRDKFRMRHERAPHEKLSDVSSSSSESSSDSTSDEAGDLTESGLQDVLPKDVRLGRASWRKCRKRPAEDVPKPGVAERRMGVEEFRKRRRPE